MQQTKGSTSRTSAVGYGCDKHARPFTYGWKRLARTSGMQQHTEHRSVRSCSKLSVMTRAVSERPPPASFARQRSAVKRCSDAHRQRALLQESLLESAPSQTNTEGRLTIVSLCLVLFSWQLVLLVTSVSVISLPVATSISFMSFGCVCLQLGAPHSNRLCSILSTLCWELVCCPSHMH